MAQLSRQHGVLIATKCKEAQKESKLALFFGILNAYLSVTIILNEGFLGNFFLKHGTIL